MTLAIVIVVREELCLASVGKAAQQVARPPSRIQKITIFLSERICRTVDRIYAAE